MIGFWLILIVFWFMYIVVKAVQEGDELERAWNFFKKFFNTYHQFLTFGIFTVFDMFLGGQITKKYQENNEGENKVKE